MISHPEPLVAVTAVVPKLNATFDAVTVIRRLPLEAVFCSKVKLPVTEAPRNPSVAPVPLICRYGPAGSATVMGVAPTVTVSFTAVDVWLIRTVKVPPKVTAAACIPTVTVASPANPAFVIRNAPDPLVIVNILVASDPRLKLMPVAATVTT